MGFFLGRYSHSRPLTLQYRHIGLVSSHFFFRVLHVLHPLWELTREERTNRSFGASLVATAPLAFETFMVLERKMGITHFYFFIKIRDLICAMHQMRALCNAVPIRNSRSLSSTNHHFLHYHIYCFYLSKSTSRISLINLAAATTSSSKYLLPAILAAIGAFL